MRARAEASNYNSELTDGLALLATYFASIAVTFSFILVHSRQVYPIQTLEPISWDCLITAGLSEGAVP